MKNITKIFLILSLFSLNAHTICMRSFLEGLENVAKNMFCAQDHEKPEKQHKKYTCLIALADSYAKYCLNDIKKQFKLDQKFEITELSIGEIKGNPALSANKYDLLLHAYLACTCRLSIDKLDIMAKNQAVIVVQALKKTEFTPGMQDVPLIAGNERASIYISIIPFSVHNGQLNENNQESSGYFNWYINNLIEKLEIQDLSKKFEFSGPIYGTDALSKDRTKEQTELINNAKERSLKLMGRALCTSFRVLHDFSFNENISFSENKRLLPVELTGKIIHFSGVENFTKERQLQS